MRSNTSKMSSLFIKILDKCTYFFTSKSFLWKCQVIGAKNLTFVLALTINNYPLTIISAFSNFSSVNFIF